jgi:flagellar biogenesis protein FliO
MTWLAHMDILDDMAFLVAFILIFIYLIKRKKSAT